VLGQQWILDPTPRTPHALPTQYDSKHGCYEGSRLGQRCAPHGRCGQLSSRVGWLHARAAIVCGLQAGAALLASQMLRAAQQQGQI
jgi:hypothetical protein